MNISKILTVISAMFLCNPVAASDMCGGFKVNIEVSPYWELLFYVKSPNVAHGYMTFLLDTGANSNFIDIDSLSDSAKVSGAISMEDSIIFDGRRDNFTASKIYSKEGSKKINATLGMINFKKKSIELDLMPGQESVYLSKEKCPAEKLIRNGFAPISQKGFSRTNGAEEIEGDYSKIDLPVVFLKIGSNIFPSIVDTGYRSDPGDDRFIEVNRAFLDQILRDGLTIKYDNDLEMYDCHGSSHSVKTFRINEKDVFISDERGLKIRKYENKNIRYVLSEDNVCSHIGSFSKPLALIDASFVGSWTRMVIDGIAQKVWIPIEGQ